jgi:hypothetical protein
MKKHADRQLMSMLQQWSSDDETSIPLATAVETAQVGPVPDNLPIDAIAMLLRSPEGTTTAVPSRFLMV